MVVTLFCPNLKCRSILQVPENTRTKKVRCGQCGTTFIVPAKREPAEATTPTILPKEEKPAGS